MGATCPTGVSGENAIVQAEAMAGTGPHPADGRGDPADDYRRLEHLGERAQGTKNGRRLRTCGLDALEHEGGGTGRNGGSLRLPGGEGGRSAGAIEGRG